MSPPAAWLNTAWMIRCGAEAAAFARASRDPAAAQSRILRQILRANRETGFGAAHRFAEIADPRAYQRRVPLGTYADFAGAVGRIAAGETGVLTREPVRLLEPTSGTAGGEKLIPYTAGLSRQFRRGVAAWVADLFRGRPAVRRGRAYWSVSPAFGPVRRSPGGLPIGFADDVAYLGGLEQCLLRRLLVTPPAAALAAPLDGQPGDLVAFRYGTLLAILAAGDLALVSVWNPSFLTALLAPLEDWQDRLCFDLRRGTYNPPVPSKPQSRGTRPDPVRAERLARILRGREPLAERLRQVWPRLALMSCWADAAAALSLAGLRELFPSTEVQPKGLLATEGFVSFPLVDRPGAALALRCHFFEFEEAGPPSPARCRLAHELELGGSYRVILTTAGGLYRYQLRDEVQVVGFHHRCPLIRFLGKCDQVSDLVGEKLAEPHVRAVLDRLMLSSAFKPSFMMLVPAPGRLPRYLLYVQGAGLASSPDWLGRLRAGLQLGLEANPYYRHAVGTGQLGEVEVVALDPAGESAWLVYERECLAAGQKCGAIKPPTLDRRTTWPERFEPLRVAAASGQR